MGSRTQATPTLVAYQTGNLSYGSGHNAASGTQTAVSQQTNISTNPNGSLNVQTVTQTTTVSNRVLPGNSSAPAPRSLVGGNSGLRHASLPVSQQQQPVALVHAPVHPSHLPQSPMSGLNTSGMRVASLPPQQQQQQPLALAQVHPSHLSQGPMSGLNTSGMRVASLPGNSQPAVADSSSLAVPAYPLSPISQPTAGQPSRVYAHVPTPMPAARSSMIAVSSSSSSSPLVPQLPPQQRFATAPALSHADVNVAFGDDSKDLRPVAPPRSRESSAISSARHVTLGATDGNRPVAPPRGRPNDSGVPLASRSAVPFGGGHRG
jgi:hypothetical protein